MYDKMIFAKNLAHYMDKEQMTSADLSRLLSVSRSTISSWLKGDKTPRMDKIEYLANHFGVSKSSLIEDIQESPLGRMTKVARLGKIACGEPIMTDENLDGYDLVPDYVNCDFTLVCKGDSMIDARIYDGDIVCIKQCPVVDNGTISAVRVDGECTLKRVYLEKDKITLMPCNSKYAPMVFVGHQMNDIQIIGKATYFISQIR